jgi:hypothetical protein
MLKGGEHTSQEQSLITDVNEEQIYAPIRQCVAEEPSLTAKGNTVQTLQEHIDAGLNGLMSVITGQNNKESKVIDENTVQNL